MCMYVCIYIYIYIHTHTSTHTQVKPNKSASPNGLSLAIAHNTSKHHTHAHTHTQVKPNESASPNGLSTLARFAIAPHTLPASVLNALKVSILGGEQLVPSNTYLLAQANNEKWPAYSFRVHIRPLPEKCIHAIIAEVKAKPPLGVPATHGLDRLKCMFPITNRGISADIARHNLNILCNLNCADPRNGDHLSLTVFAWFLAAGFKQSNLVDMCGSEPAKASVKKFVAQVKAAAANTNTFYKVLVYLPLPVNTDVRYVTSSDKVQVRFAMHIFMYYVPCMLCEIERQSSG